MPSHSKKQVIVAPRKRQKKGRLYLIALVIIIVLAVSIYVYASSLPPGPPDFAIAGPTGVTITAGSPSTTIINVTAVNRFAGIVHLLVSSSSPNLTATISPANITGAGIATLRLSSPSNGSYTVTVTGISGSLKHTVAPRVATPIYARLNTSNGTFLVELFPAQAPQTVANFVKLANSGFYTNLTWHRIVPGFVIQTGDPTTINGGGDRNTWGQHGSSRTVPLEIDNSLRNDLGYLGMARSSAPGSGSSQFYINLANNNNLNGNYTVFGKVLGNGMDVVNKIASVQIYNQQDSSYCNQPVSPLCDQPISPVLLNTVEILPD